jgi:UDP-2-acetamido-2-deoxy-ribo-hexuluronate aminotransferase
VDGRSEVQEKLKARGIPTAVHYPVPLHLQPAFASLGLPEGSFPHSELAARRVMSLPMHADLDEATQDRIVAALREAVAVRSAA